MPASSTKRPTLASLQRRAKELQALARDPAETARASLASGLYDLSHDSANLPKGERALASKIVFEIIERAPTGVRRQVAERVARDPAAPKALVLALAHEEISIAFPVLVESSVLDDDDLIEIIQDRAPEYRLGTLQRETVSGAVAQAVLETCDPHAMRWLVENPGAQIPRETMEMLVEASRAEAELQKPLIDRLDLPPDLAARMYSFVSDELRQRIVDRQQILARALALRAAGTLTADVLLKTIRAGKLAEFEGQLARFSRISLAAARQILSSPTGEALAVALKAQGVDKGTFATIFILSRKGRAPGAEMSAALARATMAFDRLKPSEAQQRFAALQAAHPEDPG